MTRRRSRAILTVGATAAAVLAMVALPATAQAAPEDTSLAGKTYVALGDSYSAGYGLTPLTGVPVAGCAQAEVDYPHQLAAAYGLELTDVTCAGALATSILNPQVTPDGTAPPQQDALKAVDPDIVTVTLGGNDLGFSQVAAACVALSATGPVAGTDPANRFQEPNCESIFVENGVDTLEQRLETVVIPDIAAGLQAIRDNAPNAKVFVIGYPAITPDAANTPAAGCFTSPIDNLKPVADSFPFTDVDTPYLHALEEKLDAAVQAQAAAAGFTYIPTFEATLAHSACASASEQYVEGVTLTADLQGAVPGSLHPNAAGVAFIGAQIAPALEAAFPAPTPTPTPTPSPTTAPAAVVAKPALAATGAEPVPALGIGAGILLLGGLVTAVTVGAARRPRAARR